MRRGRGETDAARGRGGQNIRHYRGTERRIGSADFAADHGGDQGIAQTTYLNSVAFCVNISYAVALPAIDRYDASL